MFFTAAQANGALPDVIKKFEMAVAKKNSVAKAQAELEVAAAGTLEEYMTVKRRLNAAVTQFYAAVETLEATGVAVKSIDQGLLDFPAKMFDSEVWLCWKYGETSVAFWHEKDSGFAARKPLAVDAESLV